jgi:ADP-ribose pyrophosphatase YjhB (NUDIX family)
VLRELAEETGLSGDVRRLVGVHSNVYESNGDSLHGVRLIYQVITSGGSARPEVGETTDGARWFARDAVEALDLSDHARYGVGLLAPGGGQGCVDTPSTRAL